MFLNIVLVFFVFFGTFFAFIVTVKLRQVRAASRWPSAPGEIVSAHASAGEVTTHHATYYENEDKTERRNFARITYRYKVAGKQYTCSRLSVGEDLGNDDVEGKLKRYPVGRAVEVFYNPADPGKAVLERNLPEGCAKAGMIALALVIGIIAFFGYGLDYAVKRIAPHINDPSHASAVVFAATFSFLCAYFTFALWNQGRVVRNKWARARGRIETSENPNSQTLIVYDYEVNGVSYKSDVVDFGGNKRAFFRLNSRVTIKGGISDQEVEVFYDPADPAQACLYTGTSTGLFLLPLFAAVFTGGAAWWIATR